MVGYTGDTETIPARMNATPQVRIRLLGPMVVERGEVPVTAFESRKAMGLLAYLIAEDKPIARERAFALFWPDKSEARARGNLSRVLNNFARFLPGHIHADRYYIAFRPPPTTWVDIHAFRNLIQSQDPTRLEAAADLYRGEFLEGVHIAGAPDFDFWLLMERERWYQEIVRVLNTLIRAHTLESDYPRALHFARRLLHLDPWREETHRQVMILLARTGQRSAALNQFRRCQEFLRQELGVDPTPQTVALYRQIRETVPTYPHNLLPPAAPLIGREQELRDVCRLLANPRVRLVTIVGPGGVGKTRLAHQVVLERAHTFFQGAVVVALDAVSRREHLISAIADALRFTFHGSATPWQQLVAYLRDKELLLVLDGFEHLANGPTLVRDLLQALPSLKVLVTSRSRLNLSQEWVHVLEGLSLPERDTPESIRASPAVQLFLHVARRASGTHPQDERDWRAVARIVRLVDGLPLAIHLAAAWTAAYTLTEIARELEVNLDFLTTAQPDVPERHRSLRAAFLHSWRLLSEEERTALRRLAIFPGEFDRDAAEKVAQVTRLTLRSLVDRSLLRAHPPDRYQVPDAIRVYAAEFLARAAAEREYLCERHAQHMAHVVHQAASDLIRADPGPVLGHLTREIENVRQAWAWAVRHADPNLVSTFIPGLTRFFEMRNRYHEAEETFAQALQVRQARATTGMEERLLEARLRMALGIFRMRLGHAAEARTMLEGALVVFQQYNAVEDEIQALRHLGYVAWGVGDYETASHYLEKSLNLAKQQGDQYQEAQALNTLGFVMNERGEYEQALACLTASLSLFEEIGDRLGLARALNNLGIVASENGRYDEARAYYERSLNIRRMLEDRRGVALTLNNLGNVFQRTGALERAHTCFEESLKVFRTVGDLRGVAFVLNNLGQVYQMKGDFSRAQDVFEESLRLKRVLGDRRGQVNTLSNLGRVMLRRKRWDEADTLFQEAEALAQAIHAPALLAEVRIGRARVHLARGEKEKAHHLLSSVLSDSAVPSPLRAEAETLLQDV